MKIGDTVRFIQPEIRGEVLKRRFSNDGDGEPEVLVEWQENGEPIRRWIDADKVEVVPQEGA